MPSGIDLKLILALLSTAITIGAYYPYIRDISRGTTKPHLYTWLVWLLTQATATAALWYGGGNFATISLTVGTLLVLLIVVLNFKSGTTNITRGDKLVLALALFAILLWWQLKSPLLSLLMVSAIDGVGYLPTFRKSYAEPWSETLSFWGAMVIAGVLALWASGQYNLLTITYLATLTTANTILFMICLLRRRSVNKPV